MTRLALVTVGWLGGASLAHATGPVGQVTVDCTRVEGWGQDPDLPDTTIDVHLYFDGPAGDPAATGVPLTANLTLQGGCRGAQCMHGYRFPLPLSRLDGLPHPVHAYGIDTVDPNLELAGSPATYTCPPLPITGGVKRHITSPTVLEQWLFSTYFDLMSAPDLSLAVVPEGTLVDGPPQLVVAEGTTEPLWLIDQGFRRPVAPEQVGPWRFVTGAAVAMPQADLTALPEGSPLPARPVLVRGSGPKVYLLDEHQCGVDDPDPSCESPVEPTTGAGSDESGSDSSGSDSDDTDGGEATAATGPGEDTGDGTGGAASSSTSDTSTGASEGEGGEGCGCRPGARPGGWGLLLALAAWRRRPRRR